MIGVSYNSPLRDKLDVIRTVLNSIHVDDWQNQSKPYGVIKDKGLSKGSQPHERETSTSPSDNQLP